MILNKMRKGFTIIELLVVVVIIGLLTTVATTSYMNAQKKARDNARKTQVNNIANAIETYYAAKRKLPGHTWAEYNSNTTLKNLNASSPELYAKCIMPVSIDSVNTPNIVNRMAYYYYPFSDSSSWCGTAVDSSPYFKSDYAPFPMWIPGMGQYLSSIPTERNYKGGNGTSTGLLSNPFGATAPADGNCTGQCSQTYSYIKLDDSGHYVVSNRLEASDPDSAPSSVTFGTNTITIAGTNIYVAGK